MHSSIAHIGQRTTLWVLSLNLCISFWDQIQVIRLVSLGGNHLYPLSYLTDPKLEFYIEKHDIAWDEFSANHKAV